jgi:hypothetical protein
MPIGHRAVRSRGRTAKRMLTVALSVGLHAAVLGAFLFTQSDTRQAAEREPIDVAMLDLRPPPAPAPAPVPQPAPAPAPTTAAAKPAPAKPTPPRSLARPTPAPRAAAELAAGAGPPGDSAGDLSDAQVAGAAVAGSGRGGGPCDMAGRLQTALRKDALVQAAAAQASADGRAMLVWNGDWVRSHGQDGAGLAAVREVIMWEVAFAPKACRAEAVHGLVLLSMNDTPGAARLVVGSGQWRWSDLLAHPPNGTRQP